jgi:hypothetical protein
VQHRETWRGINREVLTVVGYRRLRRGQSSVDSPHRCSVHTYSHKKYSRQQ